MQNFKKNKRKMNTNHMMNMPLASEEAVDKDASEELERGCAKKKCYEKVCDNECIKKETYHHHPHCPEVLPCTKKCEPCQVSSDTNDCMKNPCVDGECCSPLALPRVNTANTVPYAINAERVFDTMKFQLFQDASSLDGSQLYFIYNVEDVTGRIPSTSGGNFVSVKINEVCFDYSEIQIYPGEVSIEGYLVEPMEAVDTACESIFESYVCGDRNTLCCAHGLGAQSKYRERGLYIEVKDLVLTLKGNCGCTEVLISAVPAHMDQQGNLSECSCVGFRYNTLAAGICIPSSGTGIALRQKYETKLSVSCISNAQVRKANGLANNNYDVNIPGGIDLILCVQEIVSILIQQQIVVLGCSTPIEPRTVDTFSRVCDFTSCLGGAEVAPVNNNKNDCGCGCGCNK